MKFESAAVWRCLAAAALGLGAAACGVTAGNGSSDAGSPDIRPSPPPLQIITDTLVPGEVGLDYYNRLEASNAVPPLAWSIADGGVDTKWLVVDADAGTISGVPRQHFDWEPVVFQLVDSVNGGRTIQKVVQLKVNTCRVGATLPCYGPNTNLAACMMGQMTCADGAWSTCSLGNQGSSDTGHCDITKDGCGSCGSNADRCATGNCACGSGAACESSELCCPSGSAPGCVNPSVGKMVDGVVTHCGACGEQCRPGSKQNVVPTCAGGQCGYPCDSSHGDCDQNSANGCETSVVGNLAACGASCSACIAGAHATALCSYDGSTGGCTVACEDASYPNRCGSDCVNLLSDVANCGMCDNDCRKSAHDPTWIAACQSGQCVFSQCHVCAAGGGNRVPR